MAKKPRTCVVCGAKYFYCPICGEDKKKPSWYAACCSEDCHTTVTAIADFSNKNITKKEAKEILSTVSIEKLNSIDMYADVVQTIMSSDDNKSNTNKKKKNPVDIIVDVPTDIPTEEVAE